MTANARPVTVLDGGMGGEIQNRLPEATQGLWSATALLERPDMVAELHAEYIAAGADVITTNTYSTIPSYLGKDGMAERAWELADLAGRLARQAADAAPRRVRVAASLPPLEESYRPDLAPPPATARPLYDALVAALADQADLFLCETMATAQEAHNAASAAVDGGVGKPVFVSWTLDETPGAGLRSGESVGEAFDRLRALPIAAFLFNCTHLEAIEAGLVELRALTDKPIGCYPNRLNRVPEGWALDNNPATGLRADLPAHRYVASILRCVRLGATIVGGCCGIGPADIAALVERLPGRAGGG